MKREIVTEAKEEAKRFLQRIEAWEKAQETYLSEGYVFTYGTPKESGAVKRASMDLTRALAKLRK